MTTLFSSTAVPVLPQAPAPAAPKKRGWLPLLTVLFLISYGLMTMLIIEQGQTIESQRVLIRELFRDSAELSASKLKTQQPEIRTSPAPSVKAKIPVTKNPSAQAPAVQAPSSQVAPQTGVQKSEKQKTQFRMPTRPASDLADDRRAVITI